MLLNRTSEELFGITSSKTLTRNVRAIYKLKNSIKLIDLNKGAGPTFTYQKTLDDGSSEVVTGKILGYGALKPLEFGEVGKITVKTNFGVEAAGIYSWLRLYGTVAPQGEFTINKATGLRTDVFETEIALKRHVEEYLPMFGQKVQVKYAGIPPMCNRCYKSGHLRRECNNRKVDWIEYVNNFLENGVKIDLIGSWKNALSRWKNANATSEAASRPEPTKE